MKFAKYSASGNDFALVLASEMENFGGADRAKLAARFCDRREGIGADGFIVINPLVNSDCDFAWDFYNADGSVAAMCGNGARAAAHFANLRGAAGEKTRFLTGAGEIAAQINDDFVSVQLTGYEFQGEFAEMGYKWQLINTGVPHLVTKANLAVFDDLPLADLRRKYNANVNVYDFADGGVKTRTFERGVENETLACGTGMAACFLAARALGLIGDKASVFPKSGEELSLELREGKIFLGGKVRKVFEGVI
ncbi:MAG: diaminopimelate epimerase [Helicobacteraceae bacterium]|jgi:diaminopimelate epimerase|nr:diaminopimelate epimerase [Helicobacteraceae bacterium]